MKQKPPSIVPVLILTLLTAVSWVFFSIYRAVASKPQVEVSDSISAVIVPTLDKKTIEETKTKLFLDDSQIPSTAFSFQSPSVSASPSPVATSSATPSPSPQASSTATPSASLAP